MTKNKKILYRTEERNYRITLFGFIPIFSKTDTTRWYLP